MDLYREVILDHYKNPRNQDPVARKDKHGDALNSTCGDKLSLDLELDDDKVSNVSFVGDGCAISQASASLLSEEMKGKTLEELSTLSKTDVEQLLEGPVNPGREQCATLVLKALQEALA